MRDSADREERDADHGACFDAGVRLHVCCSQIYVEWESFRSHRMLINQVGEKGWREKAKGRESMSLELRLKEGEGACLVVRIGLSEFVSHSCGLFCTRITCFWY